MTYKILPTSRFKRDVKRLQKAGKDMSLLEEVIDQLANDIPLDRKHLDHELQGNMKGFRECHILPDWLLIYVKDKNALILGLTRTGSHSDLFKK